MMALEGLERVLQVEESRETNKKKGAKSNTPMLVSASLIEKAQDKNNSTAVKKRAHRIWKAHFVSCALCHESFSKHRTADATFCDECKCYVCSNCDCKQYHLSYQEELWAATEEKTEAKKNAKKSKNKKKKQKQKKPSRQALLIFIRNRHRQVRLLSKRAERYNRSRMNLQSNRVLESRVAKKALPLTMPVPSPTKLLLIPSRRRRVEPVPLNRNRTMNWRSMPLWTKASKSNHPLTLSCIYNRLEALLPWPNLWMH